MDKSEKSGDRMIVIKLGGSVITDKKVKCKYQEITQSLINQIAKAEKQMIVIHGGGSFGHPFAKEYNLNKGLFSKEQLKGFSITHSKVRELNLKVIRTMLKVGMKPVSIPPLNILYCSSGVISEFNSDIFKELIEKGFTPVTFGDVVIDRVRGCSICSGDMLAEALAKIFNPDKVIFLVDVDGLYTQDPSSPEARLLGQIEVKDLGRIKVSEQLTPDVTGGMKGKIKAIKSIARYSEVSVVNGKEPRRLYKALVGSEFIGTQVRKVK
jgi:isopentenyl phosphate kinase